MDPYTVKFGIQTGDFTSHDAFTHPRQRHGFKPACAVSTPGGAQYFAVGEWRGRGRCGVDAWRGIGVAQ